MIYTLYCLQLIINTVDYNYIKDITTMIVLLQEYLLLFKEASRFYLLSQSYSRFILFFYLSVMGSGLEITAGQRTMSGQK